MEERPQFIGIPTRGQPTELVQDSPRVAVRRVRDDVAASKEVQPSRNDVMFDLESRSDYRGLRTVRDMRGKFRGRYTITNPHDEPSFIFFRCSHPRPSSDASGPIVASGLGVESSVAGTQESTADAWFWSGELGAGESTEITVHYLPSKLRSVRYSVDSRHGMPMKHHRVEIKVKDAPEMRFESSDGPAQPKEGAVVWAPTDFLPPGQFSARITETRNFFSLLSTFLEIGPGVSLLFILATMAVLLTRRAITALQALTITAGYALYFPLILYLSVQFPFWIALMIAVVIPGALLVNYARWLIGPRLGMFGGAVFLAVYQVFPTLAAFPGWHRGLVLLCLGVVTLYVLVQLQNHAMRQRALAAVALLLASFLPAPGNAEDVRVILPASLVKAQGPQSGQVSRASRVALGIAMYDVSVEERFLSAKVTLPFEVLQSGETPVELIRGKIFLTSLDLPQHVRLVPTDAGIGLQAIGTGAGDVCLTYRAPLQLAGNRVTGVLPVLNAPSGDVRLQTMRADLEFDGGSLWSKTLENDVMHYEVGGAGGQPLTLGWEAHPTGAGTQEPPPGEPESRPSSLERLYGIRISSSQQLSVVSSDGTCTHLAEFLLPPFHPETF